MGKITENKTNINLLSSIKKKYPLLFEEFLKNILNTAVPDFTLLNVEKILSNIKNFNLKNEYIPFLVNIASFSPFLTGIILKNTDYFLSYLFLDNNLETIKSKNNLLSDMKEFCKKINDLDKIKKYIRYFKQQEFLRIGAQDILHICPINTITYQLSELAEAFLQFTTEWLQKHIFKQVNLSDIIILGMGKLAGKDLNFSSDIDLVYLYSNVNERLKYVYINFFETLTKLISEITEDGFLFRVDLRLRPDGINGPIAMDVDNAIFYYENFGRTWERGVLLKATPVAGNIEKGKNFLNSLKSFIYRRSLDFKVAEEIFQMKQKINNSIKQSELSDNIKLGIGGIREIEFIMQAIQLIFGGKYIEIREKNCIKFFKIIKKYKFLKNSNIDFLIFSYKFLRSLEHKIQIFLEKQTHSLPKNNQELKIISFYFGFKEIEAFLDYQLKVRKKVHNIFNNFIMFREIDLDVNNKSETTDFKDKDILIQNLNQHNIKNLENILFDFFYSLPESTEFEIKKIFSYIFDLLGKFKNKEEIITNFTKLLDKLKFNKGYISFLMKNKIVIEILMNIFSKSIYLSNIILKYRDIFEEIFFTDFFKTRKEKKEILDEIKLIVENSLCYEDILENLRIYKKKEELRLGLHFLNSEINVIQLLEQLTFLADVLFEKSTNIVLEEFKKKYGDIDANFTILSLGKFGSRELNFSSDLDIILIIEKDTKSNKGLSSIEYFSRFLQRLISFLSIRTKNGIIYEIDTRLRPSGNSGTLVTTFEAFKNYQLQSAATWELQALLKARIVAGSPFLGEKIINFIKLIIENHNFNKDNLNEILHIRDRIEKEEGKENEKIIDIKKGSGGIIDVEFLVQILMLKNRIFSNNGNTFEMLKNLNNRKILDNSIYKALYNNYFYLRTIENLLRMQMDSHTDKISFNNILFNDIELEKIIHSKKVIRKNFNKILEELNESL